MLYQVSRNGQMYGPYTLEDLTRYVASGNVLPTDMAKSESMPSWLPVGQVLGTSAPPQATAPYPPPPQAPGPYSAPALAFPPPPGLHWGLCLLFGFLTCGIFNLIYDLIQTVWMKKVDPASKSMFLYLGFIILWFVNTGGSVGRLVLLGQAGGAQASTPSLTLSTISLLVSLGVFILVLMYRFTMRAELERHFNGPDPIGLRLSGVMTFFFGGLYFQYHLNRIHELKRSLTYQTPY